MNIKKSNVFLYPLDSKVIFPYHEYTFTINSSNYDRTKFIYLKLTFTTIWLVLSLKERIRTLKVSIT